MSESADPMCQVINADMVSAFDLLCDECDSSLERLKARFCLGAGSVGDPFWESVQAPQAGIDVSIFVRYNSVQRSLL